MYQILAKLNKLILPSYCRKELDLAKASKLQLAILGWRAFITKKSINQ